MSGTIRFNLLIGRAGASEEELWEALRRLGDTPIRPRTALATAALSLVTLWAATTRLASPSEENFAFGQSAPAGSVALVNGQGTVVGLLVPRQRVSAPRSMMVYSSPVLGGEPLLTTSWQRLPASSAPSFTSAARPRLDQAYMLAGFPH